MVSEVSLLKTRNFTGDVRLINFFATQQFRSFDISFNTACKELKIAQIAQLNQLFQLLHLAHIYGHCFYSVIRFPDIQWRMQEKILFKKQSCCFTSKTVYRYSVMNSRKNLPKILNELTSMDNW